MGNKKIKSKLIFLGNRYKPICFYGSKLICYKKGSLYYLENASFCLFYKLSLSIKEKISNSTKLLTRIFRAEPQCGAVYKDHLFLCTYNSILEIDLITNRLVKNHLFRARGIHCSRIYLINGLSGFDDSIAFGEYSSNKNKDIVNIYSFNNESHEFEVAYKFPQKTIKHIHSLIVSKERNSVFILTGDSDEESGIYEAKNNFKSVKPVLVGTQDYRSVIAFAGNDCLVYATDTPAKQNFVCLYNFKDKTVKKLHEISGSCTTGCKTNSGFIFCSTVETKEPRNNSKIEKIRYLFRKKLADGIKDNYCRVYMCDYNSSKEIFAFKKDMHPAGLARFGRVFVLYNNKELYLYPVAVKKFDSKLYKYIL